MRGPWSHFRHGADIGVEGFGVTREDAFANAAVALTAVITEPRLVKPTVAVDIACEAPQLDLLFLDWLNAVIYEMASRRMLFARFEVRIDGLRLRARAWGETVNRERHEPAAEIKAATFTELCVRRDEAGWRARCVVDV